jgi:GNAT superfamily N-acetyltransferase
LRCSTTALYRTDHDMESRPLGGLRNIAETRQKVASRMLERLTTYFVDLDAVIPDTLLPQEYHLVRPTIDDLHSMMESNEHSFTMRKVAVLSKRLDGACDVWLIRSGDGHWVGWCHMIWGSGPNTRINHTLRLNRDEVYLFDDGTVPEHRRQGVHSFAISQRLRLARQQGARVAITAISMSNAASIASFERWGFKPRTRIYHLPLLRRSFEVPLMNRLFAGLLAGAARGRSTRGRAVKE